MAAPAMQFRLSLQSVATHPPTPEAQKPFTVYVISVQYVLGGAGPEGNPLPALSWLIPKRYSELDVFRTRLDAISPGLPPLASKMVLDPLKPEVVAARQAAVAAMLQAASVQQWSGEAGEMWTHFLDVRHNVPLVASPPKFAGRRSRLPPPSLLDKLKKKADEIQKKNLKTKDPLLLALIKRYYDGRDYPLDGVAALGEEHDVWVAWSNALVQSPDFAAFKAGWEVVSLGETCLLATAFKPLEYIYLPLDNGGSGECVSEFFPIMAEPSAQRGLAQQVAASQSALAGNKSNYYRALRMALPAQCWWTPNDRGINTPYVATMLEDGTPRVHPCVHAYPTELRDYQGLKDVGRGASRVEVNLVQKRFVNEVDRYQEHVVQGRSLYVFDPQGVGIDTVLEPAQLPAPPLNFTSIYLEGSAKYPLKIARLPWAAYVAKSRAHHQRMTIVHKMRYDETLWEMRTKPSIHISTYPERKEEKNGLSPNPLNQFVHRPAREALIRSYNLQFGRASSQPAVDGWFGQAMNQWEGIEFDEVRDPQHRTPLKKRGTFHILYQNVDAVSGQPLENFFRTRVYTFLLAYNESEKKYIPSYELEGKDPKDTRNGEPFVNAYPYDHRYTAEGLAAEVLREAERLQFQEFDRQRAELGEQAAAEKAQAEADKKAALAAEKQAALDAQQAILQAKRAQDAAEKAVKDEENRVIAAAALADSHARIERLKVVQADYQKAIAELHAPANSHMDAAHKTAVQTGLALKMQADIDAINAAAV